MNDLQKVPCGKCGVMILPNTAESNDGNCVPCNEGRRRHESVKAPEIKSGRHADWMCIEAKIDQDTKDYIDYEYMVGVWDKDPRFRSRSFKVATSHGLMRIYKNDNHMEILIDVPEDEMHKCVERIYGKICKDAKSGDWPEETVYACG